MCEATQDQRSIILSALTDPVAFEKSPILPGKERERLRMNPEARKKKSKKDRFLTLSIEKGTGSFRGQRIKIPKEKH